MSLFSLVACFMGTMAWFSFVNKINNEANDFNVIATTSMVKSISVYNQNSINTPYVFKTTPAVKYNVYRDVVTKVEENEDISLRYYSSLDDAPDSTLLYLFEIDPTRINTSDDFNIRIKTDTPDSAASGAKGTNGSLVFKKADGSPAHKLAYDVDAETKAAMQAANNNLLDDNFGKNSMSSIISFDVQKFDSALTITDGKYNLASSFANITSKSFVNQNNAANQVTNFAYTMPTIQAFTRSVDSAASCPAYVAVVCHYNAASIQYIFNMNLGNPVTDSESINFTCDWYFEIR